jgi:hypothetical protein
MTFLHGLSLISDRQQLVNVASTHSTTALSTYGVHLMFILGHLLCLVYVNDMSATLSNKLLLYAHAVTSIRPGKKKYDQIDKRTCVQLKSVKNQNKM